MEIERQSRISNLIDKSIIPASLEVKYNLPHPGRTSPASTRTASFFGGGRHGRIYFYVPLSHEDGCARQRAFRLPAGDRVSNQAFSFSVIGAAGVP